MGDSIRALVRLHGLRIRRQAAFVCLATGSYQGLMLGGSFLIGFAPTSGPDWVAWCGLVWWVVLTGVGLVAGRGVPERLDRHATTSEQWLTGYRMSMLGARLEHFIATLGSDFWFFKGGSWAIAVSAAGLSLALLAWSIPSYRYLETKIGEFELAGQEGLSGTA